MVASVGAVDREAAMRIVGELVEERLVSATDLSALDVGQEFGNLLLTVAGWRRFEAEAVGKFASNYGFAALKFGDVILDRLFERDLKPAIREIGFELVDMRDRAKAGIIDNLMREQIRDSAFVVVDLTHDNSGAYWEAGYAEGLGKPVLYICERAKFSAVKTHFDTSHSTTVLWDADDPAPFLADIKATLRRSLGLFNA